MNLHECRQNFLNFDTEETKSLAARAFFVDTFLINQFHFYGIANFDPKKETQETLLF